MLGRVGQHSGITPLTRKKSKTKKTAAVKDHMLQDQDSFLLRILKF